MKTKSTNSTSDGVGVLSIFCVQGSKILGSIDLSETITALYYIDKSISCKILPKSNGFLAIGTAKGKIFLVDLLLPQSIRDIRHEPSHDGVLFSMVNIKVEEGDEQIYGQHEDAYLRRRKGEKIFFSLQINELLDDSGAILTMMTIPNAYLLSIGLNDGRMILFDLIELEAFHLAYPPGNQAPLTQMSYIEPIDDPRAGKSFVKSLIIL